MHRTIYSLLCSSIILTSCIRDSAPDETRQVYERLHGKYKAVSSISSEAVDVNLDGTASINILAEIPDLEHCNLEIRILSEGLLCQFWPQQFVGHGTEPAGYDPSLTVHYANQGITRTFPIDANSSVLQLQSDTQPLPDLNRFPFPTAVTVESTNMIKIVFSKRLYTSAGWKTVTVTTLYERYTMIT